MLFLIYCSSGKEYYYYHQKQEKNILVLAKETSKPGHPVHLLNYTVGRWCKIPVHDDFLLYKILTGRGFG
jgi:hypothetical protein